MSHPANMDDQTRRTLRDISRGVPAELARNVTKTVVDRSQENAARAALKNPGVSREQKERVRQLLDRGAFRREEVVVNEKATKEIERYHETKIAQARREGKLADPSKDPFVREREARMRARQK